MGSQKLGTSPLGWPGRNATVTIGKPRTRLVLTVGPVR
jgi:hypothetical protein